MRIQTTAPFDSDYARLTHEARALVDKQIALLLTNARHPSLRFKRIQGADAIWEVRVSRSHRMTLEIAGDVYILRRVGPHDVLRRP